jgi:DnaJ-domain-containing protein 1
MSIGRRLIDLARAELNSLLERAARGEDDADGWSSDSAQTMSDEELEAELERRRQAREEAEQATRRSRQGPASRAYQERASGRAGPRSEPPRRTAAGDDAIRRAYAALEVQPGSDFDTVRKAYRRLMRKYHPDLHTSSPEKQRAANDVAQRLTEAYKLLEKQLRP